MMRDKKIHEYINAIEAFNRLTWDMAVQGFDVKLKVIQTQHITGSSLSKPCPIYHVMFDIKDHKA